MEVGRKEEGRQAGREAGRQGSREAGKQGAGKEVCRREDGREGEGGIERGKMQGT